MWENQEEEDAQLQSGMKEMEEDDWRLRRRGQDQWVKQRENAQHLPLRTSHQKQPNASIAKRSPVKCLVANLRASI